MSKYKTLISDDVEWIVRRLPEKIRNFMGDTGKTVSDPILLGGGFIRCCITGEQPKDIDLFASSSESAERLKKSLADLLKCSPYETGNAYTYKGLGIPVQLIHRWTFEDAAKLVDSFDFTIACAAVWSNGQAWKSLCHSRFYADLAAKRLEYVAPMRDEESGGSLLRAVKLLRRGYSISPESLGRLVGRLMSKVEVDHKLSRSAKDGNLLDETWVSEIITGLLREVDPSLVNVTLDPGQE